MPATSDGRDSRRLRRRAERIAALRSFVSLHLDRLVESGESRNICFRTPDVEMRCVVAEEAELRGLVQLPEHEEEERYGLTVRKRGEEDALAEEALGVGEAQDGEEEEGAAEVGGEQEYTTYDDEYDDARLEWEARGW